MISKKRMSAIIALGVVFMITVSMLFGNFAWAQGESKEEWYNQKHNIDTVNTPFSGASEEVELREGGEPISEQIRTIDISDGWKLAQAEKVILNRIVTSNDVPTVYDEDFPNLSIEEGDDSNVMPQSADENAWKAFDNDSQTAWKSDRTDHVRYIIDFGQPMPITTLTLRYRYMEGASLQIMYSNDNPSSVLDTDNDGTTPRIPVINANSTAEDYHRTHTYEAGNGFDKPRTYNNVNWYNFEDKPICAIDTDGTVTESNRATILQNNPNGETVYNCNDRLVRFLELEVFLPEQGEFELIDIIPQYIGQQNWLAEEGVRAEADSCMNNEYFPEGAIDGGWTNNGFDQWISDTAAEGEPHWIKFDLGTEREIEKVRIYHAANVASPNVDYIIYGSNTDDPDFSNWDVLADIKGNVYYYADHAAEGTYRYVAILITDTGLPDNCARIREVLIYGGETECTNYTLSTQAPEDWEGEIDAVVPGSIHTALYEAGVIPDPRQEKNYRYARDASYRTWVLRKRFDTPEAGTDCRLQFGGVADRCQVWLNGVYLGYHQGMFTTFGWEIGDLLKADGMQNELIVKLLPAVYWEDTVVFSNSYGWHYVNMPPLGIWKGVELQQPASVEMDSPFVSLEELSQNQDNARMRLVVDLKSSAAQAWEGGTLRFTIRKIWPQESEILYSGEKSGIESDESGAGRLNLRFDIPDPQLWWPNSYGEQNLYEMTLSFACNGSIDTQTLEFGIRDVQLLPAGTSGTPSSDMYNWKFVVNGKEVYARGANWCTLDAMMDFSEERYEQYFRMAKNANMNFMRLWGSGMPETDECYKWLDRYGLMAIQEWPNAWGAAPNIPYDLLKETVIQNTKRLRNHPSLIMYTGGNEISEVRDTSKAVAMMAQVYYYYDGSRFFRVDDGGWHNYAVGWGYSDPDYNLTNSVFTDFPIVGEFGLQSFPGYDSLKKYLPNFDESVDWPVDSEAFNAFTAHLPTFNYNGLKKRGEDMDVFNQYAGYFTDGTSLERYLLSSQIAQAIFNRAVIERTRINWPDSTAINLYKLNDNYPGASWSVIDYYGTAKLGYYAVQQSFAPVAVFLEFDSYNPGKTDLAVPVYVADDNDRLRGDWKVEVSVYDHELNFLTSSLFEKSGAAGKSMQIGTFLLGAEYLDEKYPTYFHVEMLQGDEKIYDTFYFVNFSETKDSLFRFTNFTTVEVEREESAVVLTNTGKYPAIGVMIENGNVSSGYETFFAEEGFLWLDAGESRRIAVNDPSAAKVTAWNLYDPDSTEDISAIENLRVAERAYDGIVLEWDAPNCVSGVKKYVLYRDGEYLCTLSGAITTYADFFGLTEARFYDYTLVAVSFQGAVCKPASIQAFTYRDYVKPAVEGVVTVNAQTLRVTFNKSIDRVSLESCNSYSIVGNEIVGAQAVSESEVLLTLKQGLRVGEMYRLDAFVQDEAAAENSGYSQKIFVAGGVAIYDFDAETLGKDLSLSGRDLDCGDLTDADFAKGRTGGSALCLVGEEGYLQNETPLPAEMKNEFTLLFSLKGEQTDYLRVLFAKGEKKKGHFELYISEDTLYMYAIGESEYTIALADGLTDGNWHTVALTYQSGVFRTYVDGIRKSVHSCENTFYGGGTFRIGGLVGGGLPALGLSIDEVALYSCVVEIGQIRTVFSQRDAAAVINVLASADRNFVSESVSAKLSVYGMFGNYAVEEIAAVFTSSNPSVATVDEGGTVTFVSEGRVVIRVEARIGGQVYYNDVIMEAAPERDLEPTSVKADN